MNHFRKKVGRGRPLILLISSVAVLALLSSSSSISFATSSLNGLTSPFWLEFGHDSRNSNSVPWTPGPQPKLNFSLGMNGTGFTLATGKMLFTSEGKLWGSPTNEILAINMTTGKIVWALKLSSTAFKAPFLTASNASLLYFGTLGALGACASCGIFAVDELTGAIRWSTTLASSKPSFSDNMIFAVGKNSHLYAFNAITGNVLWQSGISVKNESNGGPVAIADGRVFAVSSYSSSTVYTLNETTGKSVWNATLLGRAVGYPIVRDQSVFVGTASGMVYAFGEISGKQSWTYRVTYSAYLQAASNGVLLVTTPSQKNALLYALNDSNGALLWSYGPNVFADYGVSIGGTEALSLTMDHKLRAFNLTTGALVWSATLPTVTLGIGARVILTLPHIVIPVRDSILVYNVPKK